MTTMTGLNTTMNGTHPPNCSNPTIERVGKTVAYCLILVVSLIGNIFIGIIVYETKNHEKPHQLLHRKHGHVRSAVAGFVPLGSLHWLLAHEFSFTKESSSPSRWVSLIVCKGRTKPLDSSRPLNITICQFVSYCCISLWFSWPLFTQSSFRISGVTRYEASNQTA